MAGVCVSGVMWAIFQNNAGGAWDNAKKSFEAGVEINGEMTYKGSEAHKAAVTGDTVGDPFKDTSGPSMNILIKLTCLVGLVIAPILGSGHATEAHDTHKTVEVTVHASATSDDTIEEATITVVSSKDGESKTKTYQINGTEAEIEAQLKKVEEESSKDGEIIEVRVEKKKEMN